MKRGFFGGSFNPPHNGHIQSLLAIQKKVGLKKVHIIPSFANPLKISLEGPTPEQRLEMTRLAFETYGDQFVIDDREIRRKGKSFTIETIRELQKEYPEDELFMVIGADLLEELPEWKDYKKIFEETNVIVMTRAGHDFPHTREDLPGWLQKMTAEYDFNFVQLKSEKTVQFVSLPEIDISSTNVRKRLRLGRPADQFIPLATETYIRENEVYKKNQQKVSDYLKLTKQCANILSDKKAVAVMGFDLQATSPTTDFALVGSGTSTRHASSLADSVIRTVKDEYNLAPFSIEGMDEGRWIVIDYGALMVHIFYDFVRQEYNLEGLWKNAQSVDLKL